MVEPDGRVFSFNNNGNLLEISDRNGNTQVLGYDSARLAFVEDNFGRRLDFGYDTNGRVISLTTPVGQIDYGYDGQGNLTSVTYPNTHTKTYIYDDPNDPHNLTGIINENGIRSATYAYDNQDRAILSEGAGGANRVQVAYDNNFVRHITDSLGHTTTFKLYVSKAIGRVKSVSGSGCGSCLGSPGSEYDLNDRFWISNSTDARGYTTTYTYDTRGNVLTMTEAVGIPEERTTTYTYHPDYDWVATITRSSVSNPGATSVISLIYDAEGNLLERTETGYSGGNAVSRITTYTYNNLGQLTQSDGPRTDVSDITIYEYYPNDPSQGLNRGMLKKITDPLSNETLFSQYNAYGRPGQITDPNGVITTNLYDTAGRLTSRTTAGQTTSFEYDGVGNLTVVHLPEERDIFYTYTNSNFLERMEDSVGNYVQYSYGTEGNRIREELHDPAGDLEKYIDFEYDDFNRLKKSLFPGNRFEERSYDDIGNLTQLTDANSKATLYDYDPLNRLTTIDQPGNVTTRYSYDSHENLVGITDANGNTTSYGYDDFGGLTSTTSPDTGLTSNAYDLAGNLVSKTDANGNTINYTYDALNRLIGVQFPDSSQDITYSYDEGENGKGRLTGMVDPTGVYAYTYDEFGNMISEEKTIDGVTYLTSYTYDGTGALTGITYPNGRMVDYELDSAGRTTRVTTQKEGALRVLAENIAYLPFGPRTGLNYGNGIFVNSAFDQDYRPTGIVAGDLQNLSYTLDPAGNITGIADNLDPSKNQTFGYDDLYQLTSASGVYGAITYTYDNVGNRLSRTMNGQAEAYAYQEGTNKLQEITGLNPTTFAYDGNGNVTGIGAKTLTYNQNNRLIQVTEGMIDQGTYVYNGNGQRIKKVSSNATTIYLYDLSGNIMAESTPDGELLSTYVYLNGNRLAAITENISQDVTVSVTTSKGWKLSGVRVYAFTESGAYTGLYATTDEEGLAVFSKEDFSEGTYKFRIDYLSYRFWSDVVQLPNTNVVDVLIEEETTQITVTVAGEAKEGVKVYLFNENGSYLGLYEVTDSSGKVSFELPVGRAFKISDHQ